MSFFDVCYGAYKQPLTPPPNWNVFWEEQLRSFASQHLSSELSVFPSSGKKMFDLRITCNQHDTISANILYPSKIKQGSPNKAPLVVIIEDYFKIPKLHKKIQELGAIQCTMKLRGHDISISSETDEETKFTSYGYFQENLMDIKKYYMHRLFEDAYQLLQVIIHHPDINTSKIIVWGSGIGASVAIFLAGIFKKRIQNLLLQLPVFCNIPISLPISEALCMKEIKQSLHNKNHKEKKQIMDNLSYCDSIFFANRIVIPTCMIANLKDQASEPQSVFSIFHQIQTEDKEMHLFTGKDRLMDEELEKEVFKIGIQYITNAL